MIFRQTITIKKSEAKKIQEYLDMERIQIFYMNLSKDDIIEEYTAKFDNGYEADIKVCSGTNNFYVDPVLFDDLGHEVDLIDPRDTLLGEYEFWDHGNIYIVLLKEDI